MKHSILVFLITTILIMIVNKIVQSIRNKVYKPTYDQNIQKPGRLERFIVNLLIFLSLFTLFFSFLGMIMKETEMAVVFTILTLIFIIVTVMLKRAHDTSYQETDTYFILQTRKKSSEIFYENIIDWKPSYNAIAILDQTKLDGKYIDVNVKVFQPDILLRTIADMTFDGKFHQVEQVYINDPNRESEIINFLIGYKYGYLVEDYIEKVENNDM